MFFQIQANLINYQSQEAILYHKTKNLLVLFKDKNKN
jgi:hypothetical protein